MIKGLDSLTNGTDHCCRQGNMLNMEFVIRKLLCSSVGRWIDLGADSLKLLGGKLSPKLVSFVLQKE